jgi:hypothetical protein
MTIVFELSYCNVYGTGYQLRYVYRNIDPGIAVEYITGTSNLLSNLRSSHNASPPRIYSFFCIAGAQCREIQRLPLKFTKFMDGREQREAVLHEHSGGGTPYEVEVWYDGAGEQYFEGGWSQFVEDHDLHQGFFMTFDFHIGTSKFDVRIYDGTQCQKEYEAKVHFH